jgi:hypothetical protein
MQNMLARHPSVRARAGVNPNAITCMRCGGEAAPVFFGGNVGDYLGQASCIPCGTRPMYVYLSASLDVGIFHIASEQALLQRILWRTLGESTRLAAEAARS